VPYNHENPLVVAMEHHLKLILELESVQHGCEPIAPWIDVRYLFDQGGVVAEGLLDG
jgi:hypothetical protein